MEAVAFKHRVPPDARTRAVWQMNGNKITHGCFLFFLLDKWSVGDERHMSLINVEKKKYAFIIP